jgi:hypothetical protein
VDVHPSTGRYVTLGTLKGVSSASNQALWTSQTQAGNDSTLQSACLPTLRLRKGQEYTSPATYSSFIRSIVIKPAVDTTGAGGVGA